MVSFADAHVATDIYYPGAQLDLLGGKRHVLSHELLLLMNCDCPFGAFIMPTLSPVQNGLGYRDWIAGVAQSFSARPQKRKNVAAVSFVME